MTEHTPIITFDHVVKEFRQRGSGTDGGKRGTSHGSLEIHHRVYLSLIHI